MRNRINFILIFLIYMLAAPQGSRVYSAQEVDKITEQCLPCHKIEVESLGLTAHSKSSVCLACHGDIKAHLEQADKKSISSLAGLSLKKANVICLNCHEGKTKDVQQRFSSVASLHDDLRCFECHSVHLKKPDDEGDINLFKADLSIDCARCHTKEASSFSDSSHSSAHLKCADCHKLHAAKTISRDIDEQIDRCLGCHPAQELEFKSPYTHPLRQQQIKCSDCHNPHSDRYDKMLKKEGDSLCGQCHAGTVIEAGTHPAGMGTNHPFKTVKCIDCHKAHGSNFDNLLKYNINNICTTCHN